MCQLHPDVSVASDVAVASDVSVASRETRIIQTSINQNGNLRKKWNSSLAGAAAQPGRPPPGWWTRAYSSKIRSWQIIIEL